MTGRCFNAAVLVVCTATIDCSGCSGGAAPQNTSVTQAALPAITQQPKAVSVPMGLNATFSVAVTGSALAYQWNKNNAAIAGATASSYTTPATAFADNAAEFSVAVSSAAGSVTSDPASLTVTARAPAAGDLRFQQVDAPYIVNGWPNNAGALSTGIPGRGAAWYAPSTGTPLYVGSDSDCSAPSTANPEPGSYF